MGRLICREVRSHIRGSQREKFAYVDKGTLATIGRASAVAQFGRFGFGGLLAWMLWALVHIALLIGFRNKFAVALNWLWAYLTYESGMRLITGSNK